MFFRASKQAVELDEQGLQVDRCREHRLGAWGELKLAYLQQEKLVTSLSCLAGLFHKQSRGAWGRPLVGEAVLTAVHGSWLLRHTVPLPLSRTSWDPVSFLLTPSGFS